MTPATLAGAVRSLIARRAQHDQRPVSAGLRRLLDGYVGVAWGATQEIDEFCRADKRALVRAAWDWINGLDARLAQGWAAAEAGRHPGEHGWCDVNNLLWVTLVAFRSLPSNLPQLLLFAEHLDRLRLGCLRNTSPNCGAKATPTFKPSSRNAPTKRKPWPANTFTPATRPCTYHWPRTWSSTSEPAPTTSAHQQHLRRR
jgi:hypothetical protein